MLNNDISNLVLVIYTSGSNGRRQLQLFWDELRLCGLRRWPERAGNCASDTWRCQEQIRNAQNRPDGKVAAPPYPSPTYRPVQVSKQQQRAQAHMYSANVSVHEQLRFKIEAGEENTDIKLRHVTERFFVKHKDEY